MAADIFESYEVTIVSGLHTGSGSLALKLGRLEVIIFPLLVRAHRVFLCRSSGNIVW